MTSLCTENGPATQLLVFVFRLTIPLVLLLCVARTSIGIGCLVMTCPAVLRLLTIGSTTLTTIRLGCSRDVVRMVEVLLLVM